MALKEIALSERIKSENAEFDEETAFSERERGGAESRVRVLASCPHSHVTRRPILFFWRLMMKLPLNRNSCPGDA